MKMATSNLFQDVNTSEIPREPARVSSPGRPSQSALRHVIRFHGLGGSKQVGSPAEGDGFANRLGHATRVNGKLLSYYTSS